MCIFKNEICEIFHKLSSQIFYPLKNLVGGYIFLSKHLINFLMDKICFLKEEFPASSIIYSLHEVIVFVSLIFPDYHTIFPNTF